LGSSESQGAGSFGPSTRDRMKEIVASRNFTTRMIAETSAKSANIAEALLAQK